MQIGNKFRIYPTPIQAQALLRWIGCQRFIYNSKVGEDRYFRTFARKSLALTGEYPPIDQKYAQFIGTETGWLQEVPSVVLRNGAVLWRQAYGRFFKKLGGRPAIHRRHGKQSVWLTSELFRFEPDGDDYKLFIGTKKYPVGEIELRAHQEYRIPASLHISVHAGRWHVSFNYDDGIPEFSEKDIAEWLLQFDEVELRRMTVGLDRGVNLPLAGSDQQQFGFSEIQQRRIEKQERFKKRWQRRQMRRKPGSSGWLKAKCRVAKHSLYSADVRRDVAHKTSQVLAADPRYKLYAFEALKVKNMTRSAKGSIDQPGKNVRQKAGLNKSILDSAWGQMRGYLQYKARRQGKLVIEVPPFHSSQECAVCGHIHPDNRISQSEFVCLSCGNIDHADHNAAKVIALRGVRQLLAGKCVSKEPKRCGITRKQVGAEGSKPVASRAQPTPGETMVRHRGRYAQALRSQTQEIPAISQRL